MVVSSNAADPWSITYSARRDKRVISMFSVKPWLWPPSSNSCGSPTRWATAGEIIKQMRKKPQNYIFVYLVGSSWQHLRLHWSGLHPFACAPQSTICCKSSGNAWRNWQGKCWDSSSKCHSCFEIYIRSCRGSFWAIGSAIVSTSLQPLPHVLSSTEFLKKLHCHY